jgi:hypothetical protein
MRTMTHDDLDEAVDAMLRVLTPRESADWSVPAGPVEWSCWTTAAHVAHDLMAYAGQVAGRPGAGYLPYDLVVKPEATVAEVLAVVRASGRLLSCVIAASDPDDRAWHWGPCDPGGFAAMGVAETLLHTFDITQGLDEPWLPPANLAAGVLRRLFPDAPPGDPVPVLLYSTGRAELEGRPRLRSWVWHAAVPSSQV